MASADKILKQFVIKTSRAFLCGLSFCLFRFLPSRKLFHRAFFSFLILFGLRRSRVVAPSNAAVASSPKLLDRVRWRLRAKHYSIRTGEAYVDWRKALGYALKISTVFWCIMCTCFAQEKTVDFTLVTRRIFERDLMNM